MSQFLATNYAHSLSAAGASNWFYMASNQPVNLLNNQHLQAGGNVTETRNGTFSFAVSAGESAAITQRDVLEIGKRYLVELTVDEYTSGRLVASFDGWNSLGVEKGKGTYQYLSKPATSSNFSLSRSGSQTEMTISNLKCFEYQTLGLGINLAKPKTLDVSWIDKGNGRWLAPKVFTWLYLRQTINFMPFTARLEFSCKGVVKFNNQAYHTGRHSIDIPASTAYPRLLATQVDTVISDISLREILG